MPTALFRVPGHFDELLDHSSRISAARSALLHVLPDIGQSLENGGMKFGPHWKLGKRFLQCLKSSL